MYKPRRTTKLHYGKYLYKATFRNDLSFCFASFRNSSKDRLNFVRQTISELTDKLDSNQKLEITVWRSKRTVSSVEYRYAKRILELLESHSDWRIRVEMASYMTVYTSDDNLISELEKNCGANEIYKPEEGMENFLLLNIDTAVINKPSKYEYRVYLKSNRNNQGLANWLKANSDKSQVGLTTLHNLEQGWHVSGNYFYVRDDRVLTMVRMVAGNSIRRVEKLIYKGDIDKYKYGNE